MTQRFNPNDCGPDASLTLQPGYVPGTTQRGRKLAGTLSVLPGDAWDLRHTEINAGGSSYALQAIASSGTATLENCLLRNVSSSVVYGGGYRVFDSVIRDSAADAFKPTSNIHVRNVLVTEFGSLPSAHADVFQCRGGRNHTIQRVRADRRGTAYKIANGFTQYQSDLDDIEDILFEDCDVLGRFTIAFRFYGHLAGDPKLGKYYPIRNVRIVRPVISRVGPEGLQVGPLAVKGDVELEIIDARWADEDGNPAEYIDEAWNYRTEAK